MARAQGFHVNGNGDRRRRGKKGDAIKHSEPAMAADDGMKEDGAEAVPEGVKGAAAHAPAAEGVPQPVPNALPPNAEGEMEGWTLVPKKKLGGDRWRVSLMVRGGTAQRADALAKFLSNCATDATMRRLPNAGNNEDGRKKSPAWHMASLLGLTM